MTHGPSPRALLPVLLICSLALLAGCSRENDDWRAAQAADTAAAYQQFSREHPASSHAAEADARAVQRVEDEDWRRAQEDDSQQAYQQFVTQHPESHWVQEARVRIETISLGNATGGVTGGAGSPAAAAPAAATPPAETPASTKPAAAPKPAPAPKPAAASAGPHPANPPAKPAATAPPASKPAAVATTAPAGAPFTGIQLGAFGSESAARTQWTALAAKHGELKGRNPRVTAATTASGRLYRLQTATRDEAEARELCRTLSAAGQGCVVVHP